MSMPFDTLKLARRLEAAGLPTQQAGDMAEALAEPIANLVTKDDLKSALHDLEQKITIRLGGMIVVAVGVILAATAHAEVTMTPMTDGGQALTVQPWNTLTDQEKLEQLHSLTTAHCFPYQRLEVRSGVPVCVENDRHR